MPPTTERSIPGIVLNGSLAVPLITPYKGGPTNGNAAPISAPSAANLSLFLKLAATKSPPVKSSVRSGLPGSSVESSGNILFKLLLGPPAIKSVAPNTTAPVPTRLAKLVN